MEILLCTLELEENEEEIKQKSPADSAILHVYRKRVFHPPCNFMTVHAHKVSEVTVYMDMCCGMSGSSL